MKGISLDNAGDRLDGWSQWYYENGVIESEGYYKIGAKIGVWYRYDHNGEQRPDKMYSDVNMNSYIFNSARIMPKPAEQIPDLNTYVKEKLIQEQAFDLIALSPIILQFIVFRNGSVGDIKIDEKLSHFHHQILKLIIENMPEWIPGSNGNQTINVRVDYNLELQK